VSGISGSEDEAGESKQRGESVVIDLSREVLGGVGIKPEGNTQGWNSEKDFDGKDRKSRVLQDADDKKKRDHGEAGSETSQGKDGESEREGERKKKAAVSGNSESDQPEETDENRLQGRRNFAFVGRQGEKR